MSGRDRNYWRRRDVLALPLAWAATRSFALAAREPAWAATRATVERLAAWAGDGVSLGVSLRRGDGGPGFDLTGGLDLPTASAIKTAFLVEYFADRADRLHDVDADVTAWAGSPDHPALAPYSDGQRAEIREGLKGATAWTVGRTMMGSHPASNAVYNAAASLVTAALGGPEGLTKRVAARDPEFGPIQVRRYMLTDRNRVGDNTATASALSAVLDRVATGKLRGVDARTLDAVRAAMMIGLVGPNLLAHVKDGALDSDPVTRVESGYADTPRGPLAFAVMLARAVPKGSTAAESGSRLQTAARAVRDVVLTDAADAPGPK